MIPNSIYQFTTIFYEIHPIGQLLLIAAIVALWTMLNKDLLEKAKRIINTAFCTAIIFVIILLGLINRVTMDRNYYLVSFQLLFPLQMYRLQQIILNTLFFVPLGLTLPYVFTEKTSKPIRISILCGFLLSLTVELLQLILRRGTFETTDIIMNTLGTATGTLSFFIYSRNRKGSDKNDSK